MILKISRSSRYLEPRRDLDLINIVLNGRRRARLLNMVLLKLSFHVRADLLFLRQISGGLNVARTRQRDQRNRNERYAEVLTLRTVRKVTLTRHRFMSLLRRDVGAPSASTIVSAVIMLASEVAAKGIQRSAHEGTSPAL
jgi:hypothetical protein